MVDPVAGTFTGAMCTVWIAGSRDYLVTTGSYDLQNIFDSPYPTGDTFAHNVYVGRKFNKLSFERQMTDGSLVAYLLNASPITGTPTTIVTAGANLNTAGNLTLAGASPLAAGSGLLQLTTAGATTTNASIVYITAVGLDVNGNVIHDSFAMPALAPAATVLTTTKVFTSVLYIDNPTALGSSVTCGIASIAGTTSISGSTALPALVNIAMKIIDPATSKEVIMTFANCYVKSDPVTFKGGKSVSTTVEMVMQNPNTDIQAQFA
jgi:hypothetical protein